MHDVHSAHLILWPGWQKIRVTNPFHPRYRKEFEVICCRRTRLGNNFILFDNQGEKCFISAKWTDTPEGKDVFVIIAAGRSYFRFDALYFVVYTLPEDFYIIDYLESKFHTGMIIYQWL
jgi:hypothetical protein